MAHIHKSRTGVPQREGKLGQVLKDKPCLISYLNTDKHINGTATTSQGMYLL